ncbi:Dolichyl-phosphate-mannose-protein mannosyltransferase [Abditibacterium utsteinense]|uniref:Dolichyl-phosphate-mannose-protein mannosyltransferase n=1 Tax=Abditibacterium utsteinense TaxID=1960156 RepID=A0A2S8SR27_9BACT|nr:glycosyltransferase family 39 protein [Abditibacterium utsteinense]PQV63264.1 Dolichyl-phosphate-mannose-protein mannosyltransferase [Abditibacterium utsteinense]
MKIALPAQIHKKWGESPAPKERMNFASWLLLFCLLIGIGCRFYGLNWDEGAQLHPDERFCVTVAAQLHFPSSISQFFDSRASPLNPANLKDTHYVYGQLPLFLLKIVARLRGTTDLGALFVVGRFLAALFDCLTIGLTFLIARRVFDFQKSLFCSALVACAALHIQQSHFFVTDPFAAFFVTASFWAGARLVQENRARDAIFCGAFFGAALACKISAALFAIALLGFLWAIARKNPARKTVFFAVCCLASAFVCFRIGNPMMFRGEFGFFDVRIEPRYLSDLRMQSAITSGEIDVPFDVQWIGRAPLLFTLRNLGFWAYGWPILLSAGAGIWVLVRRPRGHLVLVLAAVFALTMLGVQGTAFSKFTRYFLPMTPFCALLAAHFWRQIEAKHRVFQLGIPLVALSAAFWALCISSIYGRPHTRIVASRWIAQNLAPGTVVANETAWDEGLPLGNVGVENRLRTLSLETFDPDSPLKTAQFSEKLDECEWIFLSSGRSWQNIPRWPQKWPATTEFYHALFDGRLGFQLEKRFDSFPRLGPWQFPDAGVEEALTVYDHPLVLLFHKTENYSAERTRQILSASANQQNWTPNQALHLDESTLPLPPGF